MAKRRPDVSAPSAPADEPASKTDPRYWQDRLLLRRYRFPASGESENSLAARVTHEGLDYFFPLGTAEPGAAAEAACKIYRTIQDKGWEAACAKHPRELMVAFEWSTNPIMWTYTTVHTLVGRSPEPVKPVTDARRVLIVETDPGLGGALKWCVDHQAGFTAIRCESPEQYNEFFAVHKPGLVMLNRSLAERMGISFPGGLAMIQPGTMALAYSVSVDGDHMFVSTPGGAEGYLLRRVGAANLLDPMLSGGVFTMPPVEDPLVNVRIYFKELLRTRSPKRNDALTKLTPRENEVLLLLSKGRLDKEIADAMGISAWTVHGHIKKIFERLNVRTRTEAVVRYLEK